MYRADLSLYSEYGEIDIINTPMLNIGWLDSWHPYRIGLFKNRGLIIDKLIRYTMLGQDINRMRCCTHKCTFCGAKNLIIDEINISIGHSEIWIPSKSGIVYVSPTTIIHYILLHFYQPPDDYIQAVMEYNPEKWNPYIFQEKIWKKEKYK